MAQPLLWSGSAAPAAPRARGWFASRWSRLLAIVIAIGCVAGAFRLAWLAVTVDYVDAAGEYALLPPVEAKIGLFETLPWGWLFLGFVVIATVLALAAVLSPRSAAARGISLGALATAGVALAATAIAMVRALGGLVETAARLATLPTLPSLGDGPVETYPTVDFQTEGILWAFWAALIIGLVAAGTAWPSAGTAINAGVGTVLVVGTALLPWVVVEKVRADSSELVWVWFPSLGGLALASVAAAGFLCLLVLYAALRPAWAGALPLMVGTIAWFLLAQVLQGVVDIRPQVWMPTADGANTVYIGIANRMSTEFTYTIAQVLLLVAAVTAWRKVRLARRNVAI